MTKTALLVVPIVVAFSLGTVTTVHAQSTTKTHAPVWYPMGEGGRMRDTGDTLTLIKASKSASHLQDTVVYVFVGDSVKRVRPNPKALSAKVARMLIAVRAFAATKPGEPSAFSR